MYDRCCSEHEKPLITEVVSYCMLNIVRWSWTQDRCGETGESLNNDVAETIIGDSKTKPPALWNGITHHSPVSLISSLGLTSAHARGRSVPSSDYGQLPCDVGWADVDWFHVRTRVSLYVHVSVARISIKIYTKDRFNSMIDSDWSEGVL